MTPQKLVIVSQIYYDGCSINNHSKLRNKMTMLWHLVNLLWQFFVKPIIVSPTYY